MVSEFTLFRVDLLTPSWCRPKWLTIWCHSATMEFREYTYVYIYIYIYPYTST
jgi:hypothetical protein